MRSLRPPPKVTPPKPPAHLFEPRDDVVPVRLDTRVTQQQRPPATMAYEDDVKFQMQQLEEEMKQLLAKESGGISPVPAQDYDRRAEPLRIQSRPDDQSQVPRSIAKASLGGRDPFSTNINPADWRKNGYPSEFAYMKAMGQLEISNAPPSILSQAPKVSVGNKDFPSEREKGSPVRRKGGAIQNLYNDEDDLRRKFVNQHQYSDQLQRQADEQRRAKESEQLDHRGLRGGPESSGLNRDMRSGTGLSLHPPMTDRNPEREKGSPIRRKGGAIQNLYNDEDDLRRKFVNQHQYSDQLQRQADEQKRAKESELLDHRGLRGGVESSQVQGMRFPSERGSNHRQPAPHHASPAPSYGTQSGGPPVRHAEQSMPSYHPDLSLQQQSQSYADPRSMGRDPSPARRQIPMEDSIYRGPPQQQQQHPPLTIMHTNSPPRRQISEAANTSLPLGMDKQSELALKRAKQEEYKRQLDSLKPRQEVIPAAHTAMVDSKSYLHTGVRATTQGPPPRADPYHSSLPAQRNQPLPAAAAYAPRGNYDDSAEKYASSNHFDHMRDTHNAPLQVRNQTDHLNYNNSDPRLQIIPSNPYSQYPTTSTGAAVDPYTGRYEQPAASIRPAGDPRGLPPGMRYPDPSLEEAYIRAAMEARNRDVQSYDRGFVESIPRNIPPQGGGMPMPAQRPSAGIDPRDEKLMKKQQQDEYRRELERQVEAKKAQKEIAKKEEEERDVRLLESLASVAAAADGGSNQRGKKPAVASQQRSDHPPPQQQQAPPMDNRYEDDIAAEIAYMKAKGMLPPADDFSRDGRSEVRFEDQRSDYGDDRRMMPDPSYNDRNNGSHDYPDDRNQYPQPARGRGLSLDTDPVSSQYTATAAASSPYKSPNQARTRFMQDIYGGDLISHTDKNTTGGGDATTNSTAWRPSGGGSTDEKRRQVILDQRQALDRQKAEIEARKKREKEEEDERDRKKEARDREAIAKQEEAEMLERKKVFFLYIYSLFFIVKVR